jgi:hypothetical protein
MYLRLFTTQQHNGIHTETCGTQGRRGIYLRSWQHYTTRINLCQDFNQGIRRLSCSLRVDALPLPHTIDCIPTGDGKQSGMYG